MLERAAVGLIEMNFSDYIWCKINGICPKHLIKKDSYGGYDCVIYFCSQCVSEAKDKYEKRFKKIKEKYSV